MPINIDKSVTVPALNRLDGFGLNSLQIILPAEPSEYLALTQHAFSNLGYRGLHQDVLRKAARSLKACFFRLFVPRKSAKLNIHRHLRYIFIETTIINHGGLQTGPIWSER